MMKYCKPKNLNQYNPRKTRCRRAKKSLILRAFKTGKKKVADEDWVIIEWAIARTKWIIVLALWVIFQLLEVINRHSAKIESLTSHSIVNTTTTSLISHRKPRESPCPWILLKERRKLTSGLKRTIDSHQCWSKSLYIMQKLPQSFPN